MDEFIVSLSAALDAIDVPPLISEAAQTRVRECVGDAVAALPAVAYRGQVSDSGRHVGATILTNVNAGMHLPEEIFGPVAR